MRFFPTALALLLLLHAVMPAEAQDTRPRYSLKQDEPDTGTRIKRDVASGSVIPLDKQYHELTDEQQGYLKSQYETMGKDDEPPFPATGLGPIYRTIATGQTKLLVEGDMTLAVAVNDQGEATSVSVLKSPDAQMTKFVASVLMLQKYKPARCNGSPCSMQFPFRIKFETRR